MYDDSTSPDPGPQRFVSRERLAALIEKLPSYGMTLDELRALQDEVVADTIVDPWTGDPT